MAGLRSVKKILKQWYRTGKRQAQRALQSFGPPDFQNALGQHLGIRSGDVVVVHCAYEGFAGFTGGVTDVIAGLQQAVGREGAVLMPTQPFAGTALDLVKAGKVFDVRRTPSQMGILSELFRRSAGVTRSVHPTHPVAGWGGKAEALLRDHARAATPCGKDSPYARAGEAGGKIVFLGTDISVMTYFHSLEEELEPSMPRSPFTRETFTLKSKDGNGQIVETTTRLFDHDMSRRRNMLPLQDALTQAGAWRTVRAGTLRAHAVAMADVGRICREMGKQGRFFYDL
jgi:aminoglycoside 3-N-acetyltransferase